MRFDNYHPAINFIYFTAVIAATICFRHPIYLVISFCCALVYTTKLNGLKGFLFGLAVIPLALAFSYWYAGFHHFGVTVLGKNYIGNSITLESLVYSLILGFMIAAVLLWFSCIHSVVSSDKVVYLFGRISPKLSLFLTMILRMVPRIKTQGKKIHLARQGMGRGLRHGNILQRIMNFLAMFTILLTWTLESFITSSDSMKSRGYTLKGRTAFSIYRFDNRDRMFVITLFFCLTLTMMAVLFHQTEAHYDPRLVLNPITPMSYLFYTGYALFCLLPMILQIIGEIRFKYKNYMSI